MNKVKKLIKISKQMESTVYDPNIAKPSYAKENNHKGFCFG